MATTKILDREYIKDLIIDTLRTEVRAAIKDIVHSVICEEGLDISDDTEKESLNGCNDDAENKPTEEVLVGTVVENNDPIEDLEKGWVEKTGNYMQVIDMMKRSLTEEQMKKISTPVSSVSAKEYSFNNFIVNLTWDELKELFTHNKYLKIDVDFDDDTKAQFSCYGTTPVNIYLNLLKQIIVDEIKQKTTLNASYNPDDILDAIIVKEFNKDYDDRVLKLTDYLIENRHVEIFDDIFGDHWYMNSPRNADIWLHNKYVNKTLNDNDIEVTITEKEPCIAPIKNSLD